MRSMFQRSLLLGSAFLILACQKSNPEEKREELRVTAPKPAALKSSGPSIPDDKLHPFRPALPSEFSSDTHPITEEKIQLGRMLYHDPRLSKNHDVSCNSCHVLEKYGVDNKPFSEGHKAQKGGRNSPTVYNAAAHFVQFWDGRSPDVEHQATQPVLNPVEMAMPDAKKVADVLQSIPEYVAAFKKAFPGDKNPVSLENAGKAMGAFERRLITPSRWDKFLDGDSAALTAQEKEGFLTFLDSGCTACHLGTLVGGTTYQKMGAVKPWPNLTDAGRFDVTQTETDKHLFKVPSLRNVAETAPYFHDGSVATLEEAIKHMGEYQLAKDLSQKEVRDIAAWLKSLTGELPTEYIQAPELPPSTAKTPKPDPT